MKYTLPSISTAPRLFGGMCGWSTTDQVCCFPHQTLQQNPVFYHMVQHKIYCWRTFPQQHRVNCLLLRGWNQSGWYLLKPFVPTYSSFDQSKIRLLPVLSRGKSINFFYFPNNVLLLVHEVLTPEIYIPNSAALLQNGLSGMLLGALKLATYCH